MTLSFEILSEDQVREACIQYATENCCYGTKFVRESDIKVISNTNSYHYQIETFTEKREMRTRTEPYRGQIIDGPDNGPPPDLWDITVELPTLFKNNERKLEVPHTAYLRECLKCAKIGTVICELCFGITWRNCSSCFGGGIRSNTLCVYCSGTGKTSCWSCSGTGRVKCVVCDGVGRLKHYKQLTVTWTTHLDSFCSDAGNLPRNLIFKAAGREVFREQNPTVSAISHCENQSVNDASRKFVTKHEEIAYFATIRMQRQILFAVPMCKSSYSWKNKNGEFYVYGFDKKVYFQSYPQKCCCCTCL